jgi:hypothetical protein
MAVAEAQALRLKDLDLFREYMGRVWASTEDLCATAEPAFFDRTVTVKPLGDMPAVRALGQVVVSHGMMHVGQMELVRTLGGADPVVSV